MQAAEQSKKQSAQTFKQAVRKKFAART